MRTVCASPAQQYWKGLYPELAGQTLIEDYRLTKKFWFSKTT
jgi:hypothetical protein